MPRFAAAATNCRSALARLSRRRVRHAKQFINSEQRAKQHRPLRPRFRNGVDSPSWRPRGFPRSRRLGHREQPTSMVLSPLTYLSVPSGIVRRACRRCISLISANETITSIVPCCANTTGSPFPNCPNPHCLPVRSMNHASNLNFDQGPCPIEIGIFRQIRPCLCPISFVDFDARNVTHLDLQIR